MNHKYKYFIGIDISKSTLDLSLQCEGKILEHKCINNNQKAIKSLLNKWVKHFNVRLDTTLFCCEHTGLYGNHLLNFLLEKKAFIWVVSGIHINKSLGLTRGKNDQIDSARIADFACTHAHKVTLYKAPRELVQKLQLLVKERNRYLKTKKQIQTAFGEQEGFLAKEMITDGKKRSSEFMKTIQVYIKKVEAQILKLIKEDSLLYRQFTLLKSVDGIGDLLASLMIVYTNEFKKINDPRKFACYAGVAPFKHSSGSSIRGSERVSHMANKYVKTTLHMAAMSAINMKGELQDFYQRKVAEGKNKMATLNAIRNKIIHRAFVCINQNRMYEKNYQFGLV